jgi:hypothetical protein
MKEAQIKKTRFNFWVWRNLPPCKEIVKLITAAEDGKISLWNRLIMKIHIRACPPCENFLKQLKFLRRALLSRAEKDCEENPSVKLSDDARERLKNALKSSATLF